MLWRTCVFAGLATIAAAGAAADPPVACPGGAVFTQNAGEDARSICDAAARGTRQLATCGLTVPAPVTISVIAELAENCLGIYHCGTGRIDILAPDAYASPRPGAGTSAFANVSDAAFFESVIRHELAHAALETMPCPFESCTVGQEYVAYTMQILFLPEADRIAFDDAVPDVGPVSRDMLSEIMLMMAPERFARYAWRHLTERRSPCDFVGRIARGEVILDTEHPL